MLGPQNRRRAMVTLTTFKSLEQSEGLFDFDTPINQDNFIINETSQIYRKKNQDQMRLRNLVVVSKGKAMSGDMPNFDSEMLFHLSVQDEPEGVGYILNQPEVQQERREKERKKSDLSRLPFMCLTNHGRVNEVRSSVICQGDIIKIGMTYFRVAETHLSQQSSPSFPNLGEPLCMGESQPYSQPKTCRICLMQDDQQVISPCKCKGSCQYVHLNCLTTWLQSKVNREDNSFVSTYHLSKFQCQMCKQPLPNSLFVGNKKVNFVEFRKPDGPYLVLEKMEDNPRDRTLFVISPKDRAIRIGRGIHVDIRMNDQTSSRLHSQIEYKDGQFVITDQGSKFGTLILLKSNKPFKKSLCLQLVNRIYKFEVMPSLNNRTYSYL